MVVHVPDLVVDIDLHEAHSPLHQAAGHDAAPGIGVGSADGVCPPAVFGLHPHAVHVQGLPAFLGEVQRIAGRQLHAGRQLVAGDAGIQPRLARAAAFVDMVQPAQQFLAGLDERAGLLDLGTQIQQGRPDGTHRSPLIERRQESGLPAL